MLKKWDDLPAFMKTPEVKPYWEALNGKRGQLALKRAFDLAAGIILLALLALLTTRSRWMCWLLTARS